MLAAGISVRGKHEVLDHQLIANGEQIPERLRAAIAFERIILGHRLPRLVAPRLAELVAQACEFLFSCQQQAPRLQPGFMRDNVVPLAHGSALRA
jgi:hypothetical protein